MRNLLLGLATAALMSTAAATVGEAQPATSTFNDGVYRPGVDDPVLNSVQFYVYLGHHYCWYGDGWRGPGWYWCGYRWRHGYGWGGGYGWRGWHGGYGGHGGGYYHGGYHGGHGGFGGGHHGGFGGGGHHF